MTNLKAVIPVAGLGMRMLPATKAIPKEMLPIVDKPLIQYVVNECVAAGIKEIILVTHSSKNAIENHFDTSFELEAMLEARVKRQLLEEVQSICPKGVTLMHIRQGQPKGLGHAVLCAKPLIGDSPFIVLLPDVLLDDAKANFRRDNLPHMVARFKETGFSQVLVQAVAANVLYDYSVVECEKQDLVEGDISKITSIIEKPNKGIQLKSNYSAVGRYVLSADIWPILERTVPGVWGRIQLTDAIATLAKQKPVEAMRLVGESFNCGEKMGYLRAFVTYGLRHPVQGEAFRAWVQSLSF
ncbi:MULTISPECIES: UTP--glucose-1-phosphate uridylyltransferase GalU [Serratia]|jgi:UTP--glucose-1-phosphate uridylyltransferase|uniref:UTP--glucose-1-phosphate uridylyltransferase n=1 Tax=Serratia liquefaciens TaxID=614 RepID=A0A515CXZ5_SERLI|nr:UTP--glucose-1-phosphate uridylyltransferase GalU [Serratia liquefaciens]MBI6163519.1 UTP--glucose-1-phosphate uridylyltransferase GalU [Serratia liquefaciens]MBV0841049.1 UTP--glucose-1-phosphate uridylyltransferase GalU [Serratia liquefaciens]QDL33031.1 UTP--glucose-1-phosphate uridylyltransferase [Serratia liquefaciens]HCT9095963.1 UTP--glucose-1-phosphate uridylyltransferase GalU [Serratia liquefaciens]HED2337209.1 UTP--glucose-1-phosphate uridylyltransferase GalU [Serratia liquefaciens